jgi:hypothetical protein
MDDLVMYPSTFEEHLSHPREVFTRMQKAGFTLNCDKVNLTQEEIKFLEHSLSAKGVRGLPNTVEAVRSFSSLTKLKSVPWVWSNSMLVFSVSFRWLSLFIPQRAEMLN